mmetsp:Transcript_64367/g.172310  ORF Transcript_64367/g.172310 Transcript_64367/m.172310 type:complete len:156 (+) Transcript_64367:579-1046(+)
MALESIDWAASVMDTIHNGSDRPATKKLTDCPLTTKKVAMPIKKEMTMLMATAIPKPLLGSGTSTGHSSPHTSNMQHEPSLGMGAPTRPSKKSLNSVLAKHSAWTSEGNVFHVASVSRRMRVHGDTDHVAEFRPIENEATMGERLRNVWCSCVCC